MTSLAMALNQLFTGLSTASILLLAALGLSLSFGLMRVINMAHGELLMMGGFLAYIAHQILPSAPLLLSLPLAFVGTALFGALMEVVLVRRLYGRPLDTLLATWGVSLILQQAARNIFGPTGVDVVAPPWLASSVTVDSGALAGLGLPSVRIFVIVLAILVLVAMGLLFNKTRAGLYIRAVNQNRPM